MVGQELLLTLASGESMGLWDSIKFGIAWFLEAIFNVTMNIGVPSYILALFVFTLVVKILTQPLMSKQMRSMRKMSQLQPKLKEIQKQYANNPQRQQQETMRLYKDNGVSLGAGCLPLLLQMPIMIALFQTLREFTPTYPEYYSFLWIEDLAMLSSQIAFPLSYLLPILSGGATFLQQLVAMANKQDKNQRMMLYIMPVVFAIFVYQFPAGLAFYWIFYSLIGAAIQLFMNKKWAREDAAEEAIKAALEEEERLTRAAKKAEKKGMDIEEYLEEAESKNVVEIDGREYYLPEGYSLREKQVKAHPYSDKMETITVVVLPDGKERDLSALKRKDTALSVPEMPSLFGFGRKKKDKDENN